LANYHDLHEYLIGDDGMHLLASPKDLLLVEKRIEEDEYFAQLIEAFNDTYMRKVMFARMWQFIDSTIEYKLKTKAAPYIAAWGTRGMGKSEVLAFLVLRILQAYYQYTDFPQDSVLPALARDWERGNTLLSKATERGKKLLLHIDEIEFMVGTGSRTEYYSMIANLETIRVLMHAVLCCTIVLNRIKEFAEQADFVLHTLFQDRINEVNYCVLYVMDTMTGMLEPVGIVDVPLHENHEYRKKYEAMKVREQMRFTEHFGRMSNLEGRLEPIVQRLTDYVFEHSLQHDITKPGDLESRLVRKKYGIGGHILNQDERRMAMKFAFDEIQERMETEDGTDADDAEKSAWHITWGTEFTWRTEICELLEKTKFKDYIPFWTAREVEALSVNKNAQEFSSITHKSKSQNYAWLKRMDADDSFQGWLKETRSIMHESFLAQMFRDAGWEVEQRPTFEHLGMRYTEDLLITRDGQSIWVNAKNGSGFRTYTANEYMTTRILHETGKEAYILYLDLETGVHELFVPEERISVGSGKGGMKSSKNSKKNKTPSTPSLLLRALTGAGTTTTDRTPIATTATTRSTTPIEDTRPSTKDRRGVASRTGDGCRR
jgi:hypothetical protein